MKKAITPDQIDLDNLLPISPFELEPDIKAIVQHMRQDKGLWRPFRAEDLLLSSPESAKRLTAALWLREDKSSGEYESTDNLLGALSLRHGLYENYKQEIYLTKYLGTAMLALGGLELPSGPVVILEAQFDHPVFGTNAIFTLPVRDFTEPIDVVEDRVPRFRYIGPAPLAT